MAHAGVPTRKLGAAARLRGVARSLSRGSPWQRRLTWISAMVLVFLILTSVVTLPLSLRWYNVQELSSAVRHAPSWCPAVGPEHFAARERARPVEDVGDLRPAGRRWAYMAVSWFGHDDLGRSLFYRVLPGFLISLLIGLGAAGVAMVIGGAWGAVAALAGGRTDVVMMRVVDVLYGLPYILMVILLKIALEQPLTDFLAGRTKYADVAILFLAIGGISWLTMARVVRGQVLSLRDRPFIEAARAAGAGPIFILRRHIFPNLVGVIVTYGALVIPQAILQESFLSFLGIGVQQPTPSLGRLAADGVEAVNTFVSFWWMLLFPCGVLVVTLLALNFIADALRDAFDPKSCAATLV